MLTPHATDAMKSPDRPTVLCIDDDPLVLHCYRELLAPQGYRVCTATEGILGLELARQDRPDVILLDVMLRGLSGYDICRKFRVDPTLGDIPVILLTAWDHPSVATTGKAAGAVLTLRKPADAKVIVAAIAQVLGERSGPTQGRGAFGC